MDNSCTDEWRRTYWCVYISAEHQNKQGRVQGWAKRVAAWLHDAADGLQAPSEIITTPLRTPAWSNENPPVLCSLQRTSNIAQRHDVRRFWLIWLNHVNVFSNYVKINKTDVKQYLFAAGFFIISAQSQETCWKDTATIKPEAETCIVHYVLILIP